MQSFGWKRKKTFSQNKLSVFDDEDEEELDPTVDWLTAAKRPKALVLEDTFAKAKRLREEGVILAESEKWWEAISRWNEALSLTPNDYEVMDMLSQAFLKVNEIYPALHSASKITKIAPLWWPGYQTLGRSQLGVGEVLMAIKSFSRAIRLAPHQEELWKDDLEWAVSLRKKQEVVENATEIDSQNSLPENLASPNRCVSPETLITDDHIRDEPGTDDEKLFCSPERVLCAAGKSDFARNTSLVRFRR